MSPEDAGVLLRLAAAEDSRLASDAPIVWARSLVDIPLSEALSAVQTYYARSPSVPVVPADIRRIIRADETRPAWDRTVAEVMAIAPRRQSAGIEAGKAECRRVLAEIAAKRARTR